MCDPVASLKSSAIFWLTSLLPATVGSYTGLGLTSASLAIYIIHRQSPPERLRRLKDTIKASEEILAHAKSECSRDFASLMSMDRHLLEAKLSASQIQSRIWKAASEENWKDYVQTVWEILQSINKCAKEVREIQRDALLTIEDERQRQISEGIEESWKVQAAVVHSPTYHVDINHRTQSQTQAQIQRRSNNYQELFHNVGCLLDWEHRQPDPVLARTIQSR
ncbi:hypothetical protein DFH07DRAFT_945959 [Mycena maculata]|uniref:Uncharacterized protein n=1 Tax=Mycena maculata TaxID=230809 RepID=A0AAD7HRP3_9AGAR|nr:hypothetical protein DFH07DRAFT_945959 [Mycena maculata]